MFLKSIFEGLEIFIHWELYVCIILFVILNSFTELLYGDEKKNIFEAKIKIITVPIALVIQVTTYFLFILVLAPIILKISSDASWYSSIEFLISNPKLLLSAIGIFLLLELLVPSLPVVGKYKLFHTFIIGVITITYYLGDLKQSGYSINSNIRIFPNMLELLGFISICITVTWIASLISLLFIDRLSPKSSNLYLSPIIGLNTIFGFLPVFIYGAWISLQL